MKNNTFNKTLLLSFCLTFLVIFSTKANRNINLSGLVMDSESLRPLEGAKIYDTNSKFLGISDSKGYFKISVETAKQGEIFFNLKIRKDGFEEMVQNEHWGDLSGNLNACFYFGMKNNSLLTSSSFSELNMSHLANNYENVLAGFEPIIEKLEFAKTIENAKANNEFIFFELGQKFFVISNTGWIAVKSPDVNVIVDNERMLVKDLNERFKRSSIKGMSTLKKDNEIAIITK